MTYNFWKCKTDFTKCNINLRKIYFHKGEIIWYTRYNLNGTIYLHIYLSGFTFDFPDFNIEDYIKPLEEAEKELVDVFTNVQEEIDKVSKSFNPVPPTEEQKERLEKLCEGLVKVELTPIQKMSDNELCRKLDIARRNVEKWQKRVEDIQNERSSRYCHWKSMQDPEW